MASHPSYKISTALKEELLPAAVKLYGTGKQIITGAMIDYLFSDRSGKHGLNPLCAARELISVERGLKLPLSGTGSRAEDPITLIIDPQTGRLLADQDAVLLGEEVWFNLTIWVERLEGGQPGNTAMPADPIEAIRLMAERIGGRNSEVAGEALLGAREAFSSEQHSEAVSKIDILAAKIAGGEASYIQKCLWLALLAATLPWSKEGMLAYVNRLIESAGGKKMSIENLGDRLYLAKHFLMLREKQDEFDYRVLPNDLKAGKFLQKFGDNEIPEIWKHVCEALLRSGREAPKLADLVEGYGSYAAEKRIQSSLGTPLELTAEKKEIEEAAINSEFITVSSKFKTTLRQTGELEPKQAFTRLLKRKGMDEKAIEDVWMALTSTDMF